MPSCRIVAIAFTVLFAGCEFRYTWESLGPFETSGAIRHVIVDPVSPQRLYAASENGGVWVLEDSISSTSKWQPLSDSLENLQMRGIAKGSADPNYIVVGNSLGFLYHSKDHGNSWARITDQNFQYIRTVLINEGMIRVGNSTRLARQTLIWVASRTGLYRIELVNNVVARTDKLFPIAPAHGEDVLDVVQHPDAREEFHIGVRGQGIWTTPDGGLTWTNFATWAAFGDGNASPMIKLAINGTRVVAKMGRNIILRDLPADITWRFAPLGGFFGGDTGGNDRGYRGNYVAQRGEWCHAIAIHPADPNTIVAGSTALFLTTDGGTSWNAIPSGHEDIQSLAFSPDGERLLISTDGGVFSRTMNGGALTDLNRSLTTMQFIRAAKNGQVVAGNADHQGIRGTPNIDANPPAWQRAANGASGFGRNGLENDHVFADPHTPGRFFVAFQSLFLLRMTYPGTGTTEDLLPLDAPAAPLQPFSVRDGDNEIHNMLNYSLGQVAFDPRADSNTILVSAHERLNNTFSIRMTREGNVNPTGGPADNCGDNNIRTFCFANPVGNNASWTLSFGPVPTPIVSIAFSATEPRRVYALDEAGSVLIKDDIDDDATAWRSVGGFLLNAGDFARQIVPDRTTAGRLYGLAHRKLATGEQVPLLMLSPDSGATWDRIGQGTLPAAQLNSIALHPTKTRIIYLSNESNVLVSTNRGLKWKSIGATLPNVPIMQLFADGDYLYAATFGRGLWRAKIPQ